MADTTNIQWADKTFNPWIGCTKVSPGCANCYAESAFTSKMKGIKWGNGQPRHRTTRLYWNKAKAWNHFAEKEGVRPRIFPSLCDPFDEEVPLECQPGASRSIQTRPEVLYGLHRSGRIIHQKTHAPAKIPLRVSLRVTVFLEDESVVVA